MARLLSASLLALAVAGCVAPPADAPVPPPPPPPAPVAPPPRVQPALGPDWQRWPLSPGGWRYAREAGGTNARFGAVSLSCRSGQRSVVLTLAGGAPGATTVRTTSATRQLTSGPDGAITLAASDPLLDAMAFSRGKWTVEQPGRPPLVLPAHAEIGRVVEDCRGG